MRLQHLLQFYFQKSWVKNSFFKTINYLDYRFSKEYYDK